LLTIRDWRCKGDLQKEQKSEVINDFHGYS